MHGILRKLLDKRGIQSVEDLDADEKATYDGYEKVLTRKTLTLEDLAKFIDQQIVIIEARWKDLALEQSKKAELIPYHTVYKTLADVLKSPQVEREMLEHHLTQQLL